MWSTENVYAGTTQQVNTVKSAPLSTMTDHGSLQMGSLEHHMNVKSVNATGMPSAAFLTGLCGEKLASAVEVFATACTTQKVDSVRGADLASTEILIGRPLLQTRANLANVTHWDPYHST